MSTVLVTGGSRGIGRACCLAFARAGYDVAFCYSRDEAGAAETVRLAEAAGAGVQSFRCDVTDEAQVEAMFAQVFGLRVLVNNAGQDEYCLLQEQSLQRFRRVLDVNATGAFLCMRAAAPKLMRAGGSVVNVGSVWGEHGASCEGAYSAAKAALSGLTRAAAKEWGPAGVRVNAVSCGMIGTAMNERFSPEERAAFVQGLALAREGSAEEVAAAVLFLAQSRYITGQILPVDGGAHLR